MSNPPKTANDLTQDDLIKLVSAVQSILWKDPFTDHWNLFLEYDSSTAVEIAEVLCQFGLCPLCTKETIQ